MGVLVEEGDPCPICGKPILRGQEVFNFTYVGLTEPLFKYIDDNAVHKNCLENWEHKKRFIKEWNELCPGASWTLVKDKSGSLRFKGPSTSEKIFDIILFPIGFLLQPFFLTYDFIERKINRYYR